jgi:hypothetical protein
MEKGAKKQSANSALVGPGNSNLQPDRYEREDKGSVSLGLLS